MATDGRSLGRHEDPLGPCHEGANSAGPKTQTTHHREFGKFRRLKGRH